MIGRTLGHYEIVDRLGAGGMGEVYRARDTHLDRDVAIKVLPEGLDADPDQLARFEREAKLLAQLDHPNIATVYDLEETDGIRFIAMEAVEGETLSDLLRRGPLPVELALRIATYIAEALEAAHAKGIIHRDLKPANVMLTPDVKVKVLDFGLAKAYEAGPTTTDLSHSPTIEAATRAGVILGTPAYMSPEQARGRPLDKRSDIWAFGCVLYEMLTGRKPFGGGDVSNTIAAILRDDPDWSQLPAATPILVRSLLRHCLTRDPDSRLHDIADARIEIADQHDEPEAAASSPVLASPRWWTWSAVGIAGGLLGALFTAWMQGSAPTAPRAVATHFETTVPTGTLLRNDPDGGRLAIAPDGGSIVFEDNSVSPSRLYRRDLTDGSVGLLPGVESGARPFFSPDGQWIGYVAEQRLWKVPARGGTPVELAAGLVNPFGFTWGPDGTIVYAPEAYSGLYKVSERGGEPTPVPGPVAWYPSFLPDGESVLVSILDGQAFGIATINVKTGEHELLPITGTVARYAPSGHLLFGHGHDLYATQFDPETGWLGPEPLPVVRGIGNGVSEPRQFCISASGTLAYLSSGQRPLRELVEVDMTGATRALGAPPRYYFYPRYSPDGGTISVDVTDAVSSGVWLLDREDWTLQLLARDRTATNVGWMPDGKSLLLSTGSLAVHSIERSFFRQPAGGGSAEPLDVPADLELTAIDGVSADGLTQIGRKLGNRGLVVLGPDPTPPGELIITPARPEDQVHSGTISPDGQWLAYVSSESGKGEVYVVPFPGPGARRLVSGKSSSDAQDPHWSPDGRSVYYLQGRQDGLGGWQMWKADLGEISDRVMRSTPLPLADSPDALLWQGNSYSKADWDLSPDGSVFVVAREIGEAVPPDGINVILNFFDELERLLPTDR